MQVRQLLPSVLTLGVAAGLAACVLTCLFGSLERSALRKATAMK
jgi:hypothetical protein